MVLITNAPRPGEVVARQLDQLGGAARDLRRHRQLRRRDPRRDGERGRTRPCSISGRSATCRSSTGSALRFVPVEQRRLRGLLRACSTTRSRRRKTTAELLDELRARDLFMLCGNPDLVVERGETLIYCAGALADLYGKLGGEVLYAGKPHRPIYDLALELVAALRGKPVAAQARAGDRRFGAHRSQRRQPTSASTACSSPPASMPRSWATGTIPTSRRSTRSSPTPAWRRRRSRGA